MFRKALALAIFTIALVAAWPTREFVTHPSSLAWLDVSGLTMLATPYIVLVVSIRALIVR